MKSSKVCITTKSSLASLLFKGLATKHTTGQWSIVRFEDRGLILVAKYFLNSTFGTRVVIC